MLPARCKWEYLKSASCLLLVLSDGILRAMDVTGKISLIRQGEANITLKVSGPQNDEGGFQCPVAPALEEDTLVKPPTGRGVKRAVAEGVIQASEAKKKKTAVAIGCQIHNIQRALFVPPYGKKGRWSKCAQERLERWLTTGPGLMIVDSATADLSEPSGSNRGTGGTPDEDDGPEVSEHSGGNRGAGGTPDEGDGPEARSSSSGAGGAPDEDDGSEAGSSSSTDSTDSTDSEDNVQHPLYAQLASEYDELKGRSEKLEAQLHVQRDEIHQQAVRISMLENDAGAAQHENDVLRRELQLLRRA